MGPFMWEIRENGVLGLGVPLGVHTVGYADDVALVANITLEEIRSSLIIVN